MHRMAFVGLGLGVALCALLATGVRAEEKKNPVVVMETSMGTIEIELYADKAPVTVANFLGYVKDKFYDNTVFHRVIDSFMIQGGGFSVALHEKPTKDPIKNEADNGLKNEVGTIAMARTSDPHSATAQFYINVNNNEPLNHTGKNGRGWGYAVFGKVTSGMDVVNKIKATNTGDADVVQQGGIAGRLPDVPVEKVIIKSIKVKE